MELPERFWKKVDKSGECWLWTGGCTSRGYGKVFLDGKQLYTHRAAYMALVGPIPDGLQIDHKCHVKTCCNPEHLHAVDNTRNSQNRNGASVTSKSGVRGVFWDKALRKWRVQAKANGRIHNGGVWTDLVKAERAAIALRRSIMENSGDDR